MSLQPGKTWEGQRRKGDGLMLAQPLSSPRRGKESPCYSAHIWPEPWLLLTPSGTGEGLRGGWDPRGVCDYKVHTASQSRSSQLVSILPFTTSSWGMDVRKRWLFSVHPTLSRCRWAVALDGLWRQQHKLCVERSGVLNPVPRN